MGLFDSIFGFFGGDGGDQSTATNGTGRSERSGAGTELVIEDRSRFGDENHVPPGCLVGDTVDDLREMADDYAETWREFGPTDFSVESIRGVDEMFATQQGRANWLAVDIEDGRTGGIAPMASQPACYFGEVMVRNYDAEWVLDRDYGWALGFKREVVTNLFGTAHAALDADPPFVRLHDTFVENYGLDGDLLDPDGERLEERRRSADVDPDEFDDRALERAADDAESTPEQLQRFARDFVERYPAYDLDYSVESLSALDAAFDETLRTDAFADARLGDTADEASILLTAITTEAGAYLGEVLRRETDATWQRRDDGLKLAFPSGDAEIRVDPVATATSVVDDDGSFAAAYEELLRTVGAVDDELDG